MRLNSFSWWITAVLAVPLGNVATAGDPLADEGKEIFLRRWTHQPPELVEKGERESRFDFEKRLLALPGDGLGPMHNATSCEDCHAGGGGAGVDRNVTLMTLDPRSRILDAKAMKSDAARRELIDLYPGILSPLGAVSMDVVVHEKSTRPFFDLIRTQITKHVPRGVPDEWFVSQRRTVEAIAERPVLAGRTGNIDFYLSQRNSPPLYGLGFVDRIDSSKLQVIARSQARRTRGRVTGRPGAGKFGWRAQTETLDQFVRGACAGELGLQVAGTPQPADVADETYTSLGVDLAEPDVHRLVRYVRSLPLPTTEAHSTEQSATIRAGKRLFAKIGCAVCHVENVYPARGLYSDLLLHDMGDLLQAPSPAPLGTSLASIPRLRIPTFRPQNRPFGSGSSIGGYYGVPSTSAPQPYAISSPNEPRFPRGKVPKDVLNASSVMKVTWDSLQREWRTPPLWGVADSAPYLHDGRAATLDAAIRWHSGEADDATSYYRSLQEESRHDLIAFLESLRSPLGTPRKDDHPVVAPDAGRIVIDPPRQEPEEMAEAIAVFQKGY